jgi:perosamine synthetase
MAKHITTTAKIPHKWKYYHDAVGYNYRLPNINAAVGCAQLEQLPLFLKNKRALAERYNLAFKNVEGIHFFTEPEFGRSNYWLNVILLDEQHAAKRDALLESLTKNGFMSRPAWTLLDQLPMYLQCPRMELSCARSLERRLINIPSSAILGETK